MTWYHFDWADFVTDGVVERLMQSTGAAQGNAKALLEPGLLSYLELVGGLRFAPTNYGTAARTSVTLQLLAEGIAGLLARGRRRRTPGYQLIAEDPATFAAAERISINRGSVTELQELPGVGPSTAAKIVNARRAGGPFKGAEDFSTRVSGIGEDTAAECAAVADFALPYPSPSVQVTGDIDQDLATLARQYQSGDDANDQFSALLMTIDAITQYAATNPHPERHQMRLSRILGHAPNTNLPIAATTLLLNSRYYYAMQELLAGAAQQVEIAMFHIALPTANHPTQALLSALGDAVSRGVQVRVLLDADRASDPYRSTVINTPAIDYLKSVGVSVRMDSEDQLLHSKFVLIDDNLCTIGSHNWSAGSYFQFDDTSLVIDSANVLAEQRTRFEVLWNSAVPA